MQMYAFAYERINQQQEKPAPNKPQVEVNRSRAKQEKPTEGQAINVPQVGCDSVPVLSGGRWARLCVGETAPRTPSPLESARRLEMFSRFLWAVLRGVRCKLFPRRGFSAVAREHPSRCRGDKRYFSAALLCVRIRSQGVGCEGTTSTRYPWRIWLRCAPLPALRYSRGVVPALGVPLAARSGVARSRFCFAGYTVCVFVCVRALSTAENPRRAFGCRWLLSVRRSFFACVRAYIYARACWDAFALVRIASHCANLWFSVMSLRRVLVRCCVCGVKL